MTVAAPDPKLPATGTVTDTVGHGHGRVHKPSVDVAGGVPVLTYLRYRDGCHLLHAFVRMSVEEPQYRREDGNDFFLKKLLGGCREPASGSDLLMKAQG